MASSGKVQPVSEEIEQRRVLFEQTWGQSTAPGIEQLLEEVSPEERAGLLRELLYVEFEFMQRKSPEVTLDHYLTRFTEYASIVREVTEAVGQYTVFQRHKIAGYTLLDEIGRGGMGVVYRARNDLLNHHVAIKMVNRRMLDRPESRHRFMRELEMIGRFKHPNIVEAKYANITPDGSLFLVMELVEGMTLTEWSRQNPPCETVYLHEADTTIVPKTEQNFVDSEQKTTQAGRKQTAKHLELQRIAEACAIVRDTARGLQAIHHEGLVHRDIKPGNLMLLPNGQVKILDLGLAKLREQLAEPSQDAEPHTLEGHLLGTPGFMAPEQMHSAAHVDIRADIYSLGCTFFFLLHGRSPTENLSHELAASLPKPLQGILDRMLAADPVSRFQEPEEIVEALDAFLGSSDKNRLVKATVATGIAVFIGIILAIFVLYFFHGSESSAPSSDPSPSYTSHQPDVSDTETQRSVEDNLAKAQTLAKIQAAVNLRYQGNTEQAVIELDKLETKLENDPFEGSDELLAGVLSAQGDCDFFSGLASDATPEGKVRQLTTRYEEAVKLTRESSSVLQMILLCKLAALEGLQSSGANDGVTTSRLDTPRRFLRDEQNAGETGLSLYLQLAEAIAMPGEDDQFLRSFAEQFELSMEPGLMTREALDLRLFALERLIHRGIQRDRDMLPKDLQLLDRILLAPYPDVDSCVTLNRFFDLAIRACDPDDYGQLVKYLCRLRRLVTAPLKDSTLVLIYFSPWSHSNGFAIYYPSERLESRRFELPYHRSAVKEAIKLGESLSLDETLVALIRRDLNAGVPIVLSWDDTPCWPYPGEAFRNKDWPFDESIPIKEILGRMK